MLPFNLIECPAESKGNIAKINLDEPNFAADLNAFMVLHTKRQAANQACLKEHGEILTDIVADMLNANGVEISIEHYQFFDAYADFFLLDRQLKEPRARSASNALMVLIVFTEHLYCDWIAFQEFDADKEHLSFLDSVHEFLREKTNSLLNSLLNSLREK